MRNEKILNIFNKRKVVVDYIISSLVGREDALLLPRQQRSEPRHLKIWLVYAASTISSLPSVQQNGCQQKVFQWKALHLHGEAVELSTEEVIQYAFVEQNLDVM